LGEIPELKEKLRGFYLVEAESQEQTDDFWVFWQSKAEELGFKETAGIRAVIPLVDSAEAVQKLKALHR
jgi:hypothetical protein